MRCVCCRIKSLSKFINRDIPINIYLKYSIFFICCVFSIKIILVLGSFGLIISIFFRGKLAKWGKQSQQNEGYRAKNFIQSFLGIKEIKYLTKKFFFK